MSGRGKIFSRGRRGKAGDEERRGRSSWEGGKFSEKPVFTDVMDC